VFVENKIKVREYVSNILALTAGIAAKAIVDMQSEIHHRSDDESSWSSD
jgi:hypothetical protein